MTLDESLLAYPNSKRVYQIFQAFREGRSVDDVHAQTQVHPWFLEHVEELAHFEKQISKSELNPDLLKAAKKRGFRMQPSPV